MRLLDRYLLRKFLFILAFALAAVISIFIIIDLVESLSDYIDRQVPVVVIFSYYFYYIPYIIVLMMPIAMLLAAMFSVGQLNKHNELTAMKASGLSIPRILLPLFVLGLLVSLVMLVFAETVMPEANQRRAELKSQYIDRLPRNLPTRHANLYLQERLTDNNQRRNGEPAEIPRSRRVFIGYYNASDSSATKISIQEYDGVFIVHRIDATAMRWRNGRWVALQGYERFFAGDSETATPFDTLSVPQLSFTPEVLTKVQKDPQEMSYRELEQFIAEVANNGGNPQHWLVDLYLKISFPFTNLIILLFGAPLAVGRVRSGGAVGVALTLVITFLYFGMVKTGQSLGQNGTIPPLLGAWLGNLIFLLAGGLVLWRVKT
ncbi:MAG: LPS export ABC transporter permease LptG [candidate division KSB1 bacterium]|nr:LPS export ABC transporter permease LptG [candidate division KSB1 bacterium]MDZ7275845.1 LPS export ABC transporter permease LptG [candidate division KSB1 bacterium]MDZ7287595.1 LPS export ABC transporter permease LptG [candidate division KSB1 bacterium]MDZ7306501.1 LPS export ABC transporter permease LptG [candidate division KSB1 bacterium]MDZ7350573.1 LPS export ABC transporter permease LptG [candidate division KSB1 bacterium]